MTLLQQNPPPIDYQTRRAHADQVDAFTEASTPPDGSTPTQCRTPCWFGSRWERFTGSDIA